MYRKMWLADDTARRYHTDERTHETYPVNGAALRKAPLTAVREDGRQRPSSALPTTGNLQVFRPSTSVENGMGSP